MQYRANCKINIGLRVVRKRRDGYHDLQTVMFPVRGLYDVIDVERTAAAARSLSGGESSSTARPKTTFA